MKKHVLFVLAALVAALAPAFGQDVDGLEGPPTVDHKLEPEVGETCPPETAADPAFPGPVGPQGSKGDRGEKGDSGETRVIYRTRSTGRRSVVSDAHIRNVVSDSGFATRKWVGEHHYTKTRSDAAHVGLAEMILGSHAPAAGSAAAEPEEGNMSGAMIALVVFFGFFGLAVVIAGIAAIASGRGTRIACGPVAAPLGLVPGGWASTTPFDIDTAVKDAGCDVVEWNTPGCAWRKVTHVRPQVATPPQPALPAPAPAPFVPFVPPSAKARSNATVNVFLPGSVAPAGKPATTTTPTPAPPAATPAASAASSAAPAALPKPAATPATPAPAGKPAGRKPART